MECRGGWIWVVANIYSFCPLKGTLFAFDAGLLEESGTQVACLQIISTLTLDSGMGKRVLCTGEGVLCSECLSRLFICPSNCLVRPPAGIGGSVLGQA